MLDDDLAIDFDEDWAEEDAAAPKIRLKGEIYTLPPTLPAKLVMFVQRIRTNGEDPKRKGGTEIPDLVSALIGPDGLEEILAKGIGYDRLGDVVKRCMDVYRKRGAKDEPEGEASAPTGAAPETTGSTSSSDTGGSSSPTGTASTDETSERTSTPA